MKKFKGLHSLTQVFWFNDTMLQTDENGIIETNEQALIDFLTKNPNFTEVKDKEKGK